MHHVLLGGIGQIRAFANLPDCVRPVAVPVRIIGGIKQSMFQSPANSIRNRFLAAFDAKENPPARHIFARQLAEVGSFIETALLDFFVEAIHHVRHPTDPRFQISDAEFGKPFKYAADNRRDHSHHLFCRMIDRVSRKKFPEALPAQ